MTDYIRNGIGAVRPYVHGPVGLLDFVREVFGAEELERHELAPESFHVEVQVGDSVLVIEAGKLPSDVQPWRNNVCVYVPDVDAAFDRAIAMGAEVISPPTEKPYQERQAGVRDEAGNTWWISTFNGS